MDLSTVDLSGTLTTLAGLVVGYILRVLSAEAKMRTEMGFIKGQLSQIVSMLAYHEDLRLKQRSLEIEQTKLKQDVNEAHKKIRDINLEVSNGSDR